MLAWSPWVIDKLWFLDSSEKLRDAKTDPRYPRDIIVTVNICTNRNYVTRNLSGGYSCHLVECWLYKCTHGLDLIIKYSTQDFVSNILNSFQIETDPPWLNIWPVYLGQKKTKSTAHSSSRLAPVHTARDALESTISKTFVSFASTYRVFFSHCHTILGFKTIWWWF